MPAGDAAFPWDIKFTITGGATYGFMLVTPSGASKQLELSEAEGPDPDRLSTKDIATTADFNPRVDSPFAMSSLAGGCGQLEYDFNYEDRYWWSDGVVTHVNGKIYPAPPVSSLALASETGKVTTFTTYITPSETRYDYAVVGNSILRRDAANSSNAWGVVYTASVPITNFAIMNGVGLICVPTITGTTDFYYQPDVTAAATWTPTAANHTPFSDANGKPSFFGVVRGTCYALVGNKSVFYTTNPVLDGWAGPIDTTLSGNIAGSPGDNTYPFKGFKAVGDSLFVIKNDAVYSIDSQQDVIEVIWQWKDKPSQYNFKYFASGGDDLIYSVGPEVYTYNTQTGIQMATGMAKRDGFSMREVLGLAADNKYMYVLARVRVPTLRSADSVALFRGVKTVNTWGFEVLWEDTSLSGKTYGNLFASPSGVGTRLYWGLDDAGTSDTLIMDIPADWDETTAAAFKTSASLWTSVSRAGFPGFTKKHIYLNMVGQNVDATNTIAANISTDLGVTYQNVATANANSFEANYTNLNSSGVSLRFDFTSNGTNATTLRNFDHHQRIRFKYLTSIRASVRVAKSVRTRDNGQSNQFVWEIWDSITALRTSNSEITYSDFLGNTFKVTVDVIGVKPTRHEAPTEYEEEAILLITKAEKGS